MKTLIKILIPALAGVLSSGIIKNANSQNVKQKSELEIYTKENKQLHEDFVKFCRENLDKKKQGAKSLHIIEFPNINYSIFFMEDRHFLYMLGETDTDTNFFDMEGDGLESLDSYSFMDKETNLMEVELIKAISPKKQLSVAKQYTNLKKQILHDNKYSGY